MIRSITGGMAPPRMSQTPSATRSIVTAAGPRPTRCWPGSSAVIAARTIRKRSRGLADPLVRDVPAAGVNRLDAGDVPDRAVAGDPVVEAGVDARGRVVDVAAEPRAPVCAERRADRLHQAAGGVAVLRVDVG